MTSMELRIEMEARRLVVVANTILYEAVVKIAEENIATDYMVKTMEMWVEEHFDRLTYQEQAVTLKRLQDLVDERYAALDSGR